MREVGLRLAAEAFRYACGDMSITMGLGVGVVCVMPVGKVVSRIITGCWFSCTDECGLRALLLNATRILNKLPAAKKPYSILCIIPNRDKEGVYLAPTVPGLLYG